MFAIRTMGVVIALSATAAFAGDQTLLRADEVSLQSGLTRAEVIADYQAASPAATSNGCAHCSGQAAAACRAA